MENLTSNMPLIVVFIIQAVFIIWIGSKVIKMALMPVLVFAAVAVGASLFYIFYMAG